MKMEMEIDEIDILYFFRLSESEEIADISFSFITGVIPSVAWDTALEEIGAYDIVSNGTYTGDGVRIGIMEPNGVCDTNHLNLSGKAISIKDDTGNGDSIHATQVTSIIATIAPDAELFVYGIDASSPEFDFSWFIENDCNVVNCSWGVPGTTRNADGTYNAMLTLAFLSEQGADGAVAAVVDEAAQKTAS
jgi:hypothetical protein